MWRMQEAKSLQGSVQISAEAAENWRLLRGHRVIHEVRQNYEPQTMKQDRSFDSVKIKYLNFDSIKCVILVPVKEGDALHTKLIMEPM